MHPATEAILTFNHGRDPERLTRKLDAMAREPFSFFRGSNHLYAASVQHEEALLDAPHTYVCGDLHLENFGSFKGDNGLVYFDLNDFDDALLAPLTVDVVRMLSSLMIAASQLGLSEEDARNASERMLSSYAAVLAQGKPRWLERATAQGLVAELLRRVKRRRRGELLAQRTEFRKERRRLRIDGRHALAADKAQRKHAAAILHMYSQLPHGHRLVADDAARRIAGTGSLGLERYVVLAHEVGMPPVAQRLIDVKLAAPTAWSGMRLRRQPRWEGEAARVVQVQQVMQAASPALLAAVKMNGLSYVVKSLQPTADRVDLGRPTSAEELRLVLDTMAHAAAWAHLRSCRHQSADPIEQLQEFAAGTRWRAAVLRLARHGCSVSLSQWRDFADDYRRARQGTARKRR
ncbi:succinate-semialdehyde dehydrogenase [Cupriavidus sp. USMAA2-4]|uniref:Succinate-semialdehyde dehydrogenase n=1 Tax=Cupriavidus malaysiensis TaxID=367825 RepID=A0A1D9IDY6_9BURK|nr:MULTISPECIES: DUF2252 family protein [Cupriavidus]AOY94780.1 succinate-semialdehyde dehydrogenase [Cupriavidus sp. USMAA2-4]AOZ02359.1 succinate-semialdehyde dehydrogenase [Cupriavidus sp. USMAHM13]AOZ10268.1 succinate-semialdehyde dehydrogenase [Cupriavidus malaysiensis]